MDIRTAITSWAGAGAAQNARRSLDEWTRAQDEVSALLSRLDHGDDRRATSPTPHRPTTRRSTHSAA
jgi:hypothetical protein